MSLGILHTVEPVFSRVFNFGDRGKSRKLNPSNFGLAKFLICPIIVFVTILIVAMWPLLQVLDTLLLGATAQLQQYNRLVLAVLCEIEPVHIRNREQTVDTFREQVAYNVAVCPVTRLILYNGPKHTSC